MAGIRQIDVTRAIRGAVMAGIAVGSVRVTSDGSIIITSVDPKVIYKPTEDATPANSGVDEWDMTIAAKASS